MTTKKKRNRRIFLILLLLLTVLAAGCAARRPAGEEAMPKPRPAPSQPLPQPAPLPAPKPVPAPMPAPMPAPAPEAKPPATSAPTPLSEPLTLLKPEEIPPLLDDLDRESLLAAIEKSLLFYRRVPADSRYPLGASTCTAEELKETLLALRDILSTCDSDDCRKTRIAAAFDFYKAAGRDSKGTVLFTGYFQPVFQGSLVETEAYPVPLYRTPEETVVINLGKFREEYEGETLTGRVLNGEVVPHYTREEIDGDGVLRGRNLELAWAADPIEVFFLHIQGSGIMELPDGRVIRVGYARSNGHPFRGLAKVLLNQGKITERQMSHEGIKTWLQTHPGQRDEAMHQNPSYVFFRLMDGENVGSHNVPLTSGRSIATDPRVFPKGAPALIRLRKPVFSNGTAEVTWLPFSRFVLNQDAGGAIKGAGRVDLYCGTGKGAERVAGSLKEKGELYFLLKKREGSGKVAATRF